MQSGSHPASGNHFKFFARRSHFFRILETYFSMNDSFRVVEMDFLASTNHSFFPVWWKCIFLTNPSFQLLEKDFLFIGNCLLHLRVLSY